jgi:hypothetical protein
VFDAQPTKKESQSSNIGPCFNAAGRIFREMIHSLSTQPLQKHSLHHTVYVCASYNFTDPRKRDQLPIDPKSRIEGDKDCCID